MLIAVLTGDLVGSTGYPAETVDAAMHAIQAAALSVAEWQTPPTDTRFTRFRGDGWQIYLEQPEFSLRAAMFIAASLRAQSIGMTTRVSAAIGIAENLGSMNLSDASGPVFQVSGRELDKMPRSGQVALNGRTIAYQDQIIVRLMFERTSRWTQPQAEAMAHYLHPDNRTLNDIALTLGISPQAVNYRLGGGGATRLRMDLQLWEEEKVRELETAQ